MANIVMSNPKIDITSEDIDWAFKENNSFVQDICHDIKKAYCLLNEISYRTNDNESVSDCERRIENTISKMAKEMVYLQTQLSILEQKTNTEIRKNTSFGTNKQLTKQITKTMDHLLNNIYIEYIMIPYFKRIGVDTSYLTSKLKE